jgi:hypothetical protein
MPIQLEQQIRTAHHEAGHLVAAATQGLKLRSEGMAVDARGEGLACYCKQPGDSDEQRERVIIATFSGYNSEVQLCAARGYSMPDETLLILSCDAREARETITKLSYLSPSRTALQIEKLLQNLSRALVQQKWEVICRVAEALLIKAWEPLRPLKSGNVWSQEQSAKYIDGEEVAGLLVPFGIHAEVTSSCKGD